MRAPIRQAEPQFSQPVRQVTLMLLVIGLVAMGGYFTYARIFPIFLASPLLNGLILSVFVFGILACFWQVVQLVQSVSWIESFATDRPGRPMHKAPLLLAPLAALLGSRDVQRGIANSSARSILESVATRIDEARDITRYLASLLIFLGLLGTFYGLATTVPAVVETIRALAPKEGETAMAIFEKLMSGLEKQLGGMGTAFSSSLLGLTGSLVIGLLELFATHGQNRFYRELEEWISSISRIGLAGDSGDGAGNNDALIVSVLDQIAGQMEAMQEVAMQADAGRIALDERLAALTEAVSAMAARNAAQDDTSAMDRIAASLEARSAGLVDDGEARMRLRSIDVQLLRLLEEVAAGRQESMAELRNDFAALTRAILSNRGGRGEH
jgi:hypothetical protein